MKYKSSDHSQGDPNMEKSTAVNFKERWTMFLQDRQINNNTIVDGDRELPGRWTGFTQSATLNDPPRELCTGSRET